jgi:CII-binding regulator of phage lambda lysogenization HflD
MPNEDQKQSLLDATYLELEQLKLEVNNLNELGKKIEDLRKSNADLPPVFLELQSSLANLSKEYIEGIGTISKNFYSKYDTLFSDKVKSLKTEIDKLANTDFNLLFKDLQEEFIKKTRADLEIELKKFDAKLSKFQTNLNSLSDAIDKLSKVDLEKHFKELQKILAEIFNAINAINLTLTNVVQTLTNVTQALGKIQNDITSNHQLTVGLLKDLKGFVNEKFEQQKSETNKQIEILQNEFTNLGGQNKLIMKDTKNNRIILIVGFIIILITIIFTHII